MARAENLKTKPFILFFSLSAESELKVAFQSIVSSLRHFLQLEEFYLYNSTSGSRIGFIFPLSISVNMGLIIWYSLKN